MTTSATLRSIAHHELPSLLQLYKYLLPDDDPLPDEAHLAALWDQIYADDKLHYFVADLDGILVSTCTLTVIPNLTRSARPYGLIENVVTHPDYRKQGLGAQILRYALNTAWKQNCYKVMLLTGKKSEEVLRFYENNGFKRGVKTGFVAHPDTDSAI